MLHRITFVSEASGSLRTSVLAVAQILGVSDSNNRRDHITAALMIASGKIVQVTEGARADLDRLLSRVWSDPRHTDVTVLSDRPVANRILLEPMSLCQTQSGRPLFDIDDLRHGRMTVESAEERLALCVRTDIEAGQSRSGTYG